MTLPLAVALAEIYAHGGYFATTPDALLLVMPEGVTVSPDVHRCIALHQPELYEHHHKHEHEREQA
jgi:hypothetical protein